MFGDGKTFSFPKPSRLIRYLMEFGTSKDSLVLDSFAGSGTTGHAVLDLNKQDGGNRKFILVEMDEKICQEVTSQRLRKAAEGYSVENNGKKELVPGLGGGFRFCRLAEPLFDESGNIQGSVTFSDLAAHVYFTETGSPLPRRAKADTPFLGVYDGRGIYLLYNGVLGDKKPDGGNVLTLDVLGSLPAHSGPKVKLRPHKGGGISGLGRRFRPIPRYAEERAAPPHPQGVRHPPEEWEVIYGEACRLGESRLRSGQITFKQVPYQIKVN